MGYHTTEILAKRGPDSFTLLMKLVTVVVWSLSLGLTKLSIPAPYAKIFPVGKFILTTQACAVFVVICAMSLSIGAFTICSLVEYNWDKSSTVGEPVATSGCCGLSLEGSISSPTWLSCSCPGLIFTTCR